jgi:hypothetical protein
LDRFGRVFVLINSQPDVESSISMIAGYAP